MILERGKGKNWTMCWRPIGKGGVRAVHLRELWMHQNGNAKQNFPIVPPMHVTIEGMDGHGLGAPAPSVSENSFGMVALASTAHINLFDTQAADWHLTIFNEVSCSHRHQESRETIHVL